MDETRGKQQDNLLGGVPEQTSEVKPGTTPGGEPKTYTQEEIVKLEADAAASAGRAKVVSKLTVERDALTQELNTTKSAVDDLQKRIEDMELDAVKGDPDLEAAYKQRKQAEAKIKGIEAREQDLTKREAEHQADIDAMREGKKEIMIWQIASKRGVDPVKLKERSKEFNLDSEEQIDSLAQTMGAGKAEALTPDSGVTIGGGSWKDLSADDKIRKALSK